MGLIRYLLPALMGIAAHQTNRIFEQMEKGGTPTAWTRLARYATGIITLVPAWLLLLESDRRDRRVLEAYLSAAVLYGVGVAVGYLLDDLRHAR